MDVAADWPFPPLHEIVKRGLIPQVRYLIDLGADVDETDTDGRSAAVLCAFIEPEIWGVGLMRILIEKGANLSQRDFYGMNVLHYSMVYERQELTKVLLKAIDFDLNQPDKEGNTALHYAVRSGNPTLTRMLCQCFKKYKVSLDKENKSGNTALQDAYNNNKLLCAQIIEKQENENMDNADSDNENNLKLSLESLNESVSSESSGFRHALRRPQTAISLLEQKRQDSSYRQNRRSEIVMRKYSARQRPPNIRDPKKIIQCVTLHDFRNSMEYIVYLSQCDNYDPLRNLRDYCDRGVSANNSRKLPSRSFSWRSEFKKLYCQFEFQCSPSFRSGGSLIMPSGVNELPPSTAPTPISPEINEDDKKHKRGRRMSEMSNTSSTNSKRRVANAQKLKRSSIFSQSSAKQSTTTADDLLHSSNESLNSMKSLKRRESSDALKKEAPNIVGGRQSRIGSHRKPSGGESLADDISSHGSTTTNDHGTRG